MANLLRCSTTTSSIGFDVFLIFRLFPARRWLERCRGRWLYGAGGNQGKVKDTGSKYGWSLYPGVCISLSLFSFSIDGLTPLFLIVSALYTQLAPGRSSNNRQGGSSVFRDEQEEPSSVVPAATPICQSVWPDPAVSLRLTPFMSGAVAHLASPRQPLAAIWVSLSAWNRTALRIAEVVDFPHSIFTLACFCPSIPRSAVFSPFYVILQ